MIQLWTTLLFTFGWTLLVVAQYNTWDAITSLKESRVVARYLAIAGMLFVIVPNALPLIFNISFDNACLIMPGIYLFILLFGSMCAWNSA